MWLEASVALPLLLLVCALVVLLRSTGRAGLRRVSSATAQRLRVAVIGGGIAGTSAAWALKRSGIDVVVYEHSAALGGNARTHDWSVGGVAVRTGEAATHRPDCACSHSTRIHSRRAVGLGVARCSFSPLHGSVVDTRLDRHDGRRAAVSCGGAQHRCRTRHCCLCCVAFRG